MKKHFQALLKGIFLGSISSLVASQGAEASTYDLKKFKINDGGQTEVKARKDNSQKFILRFKSDDSYLIAGHRSHSSHRSSSTSSGSSYGSSSSSYSAPVSTSTPTPTIKTTSSTRKNEIVKLNHDSINTTSSSSLILNLGDRLLKKGMTGSDVAQLKSILIEKEFLSVALYEESMLFDEKTEKAVIAFQKSFGVGADGIVGSKTVYYLKK
ncbi:MAG: peptidoglycan-binding domain-containing protein [Bacteroidota bacterium]|nr:peptidoglycan-binding domain-containing protein [Bacteroidota bacterium]